MPRLFVRSEENVPTNKAPKPLDDVADASSNPSDKQSTPKSWMKDPVRYKTVLCNKFETLGRCPYGPRCQFAHGASELRDRPQSSKKNDSPPTSTKSCDDCDGEEEPMVAALERVCSACPSEGESPLGVNAAGAVVCRRDASSTTLAVRRILSNLFDEEPAAEQPEPFGKWAAPFGGFGLRFSGSSTYAAGPDSLARLDAALTPTLV